MDMQGLEFSTSRDAFVRVPTTRITNPWQPSCGLQPICPAEFNGRGFLISGDYVRDFIKLQGPVCPLSRVPGVLPGMRSLNGCWLLPKV